MIVGDYGLVDITREGYDPKKYVDGHRILKDLKVGFYYVFVKKKFSGVFTKVLLFRCDALLW